MIGSDPKPNIIDVYSREGKHLRSFGQPARIDFSGITLSGGIPEDFKKGLIAAYSVGPLSIDKHGNLLFAFRGLPVFRKYDRYGQLLFEIEVEGKEVDALKPVIKQKLEESIRDGVFHSTGVISPIEPQCEAGTIWVGLGGPGAHIQVFSDNGKLIRKLKLLDDKGKPMRITGLIFLDTNKFIGSNFTGSYLFEMRRRLN